MEVFKGRFGIRRSRLTNGKECLAIYGAFYPELPIENYDKGDEMWVGTIYIDPHKKYYKPCTTGSPEDFLSDRAEELQNHEDWKEKVD